MSSTGATNPRVFKKGEVVAVRGVDDDFFLCRLLQHVFKELENAKVWWLEEHDLGGGGAVAGVRSLYKFGGIQTIPTESIMTPVKLVKVDKNYYELPEKEKAEIVDTLDRSIMGRSFSDDDEEDEESDEDEGVVVNGRGTKRKQVMQTGPGMAVCTTMTDFSVSRHNTFVKWQISRSSGAEVVYILVLISATPILSDLLLDSVWHFLFQAPRKKLHLQRRRLLRRKRLLQQRRWERKRRSQRRKGK